MAYKLVHYINQFFAGIGGEDKADVSPEVRDGIVGPGMAFKAAFNGEAEIVATFICGDNYCANHLDDVAAHMVETVKAYGADGLIAGPAFNAGRYGTACGAVCAAVAKELQLPVVSGMYRESPGVDLYRKEVTIVETADSARGMGKAVFCDLQDGKGRIQLYVRVDELGEEAYAAFKKLDVGDIIGVKGEVFRTKTGELSVRATELTLLAKSLRPLPEKFHGLTDTEMRYRQRYVDLIANPEVKDTFVKRSQILKEIRSYLDEKGFLEVDTPILTPFEIGASARPFYTHHNSLNMDMVLRIETELYLKRLIVGGMDRVYEVGRIFRNEGMDPKHNPEFTSIELYQAFTDFHGMMDLVEELYKRLALKICGSMVIPYQGKQIDMGHWERLTMVEAVKKYSGVDFNDWKSDEDAIAAAKEHHVELPEVPTKGAILAEFFDAFVEDKLIQPTFIYDYPVEISPLAKRKPDDPAFTERFEYFIDCTEYGNAFSELNDPIDQKGRFERQVAERKAIEPDCKAQVDYDYVNALEYGLPPTGGLGFGVDRLVMLLTDSASIRDVLLFPTMKLIEQ